MTLTQKNCPSMRRKTRSQIFNVKKRKSMYIEKVEKFNDIPIRMRLAPQGNFADVFTDENFTRHKDFLGAKRWRTNWAFQPSECGIRRNICPDGCDSTQMEE